MTRRVVRRDDVDLESRGRRDYWVAVEHDSIWGDHLIPLTVVVGEKAEPGRGLAAFGATHGDEYEGPVAIRRFLSEIETEAVLGRLILVPVLNPAAFRVSARDSALDDGVNLNRAFVEGAGTSPGLTGVTHRIAAMVREVIWPHVDMVFDLHAGGDIARFAQGSSFHPVADPVQGRAIEEAARWFGAPLVMVYQNQTPGLLTSEAERLGKVTLGAELGWGAAVQANGVRWGLQGLRSAAVRHGYLRGHVEPIDHHADGTQVKAAMVDRACFTPATVSGHFEPLVACGNSVREGEVVGFIHDFERIDSAPCEVRAGVDGVVIALAWSARVRQGQHVAVTGRVLPWLD